MIPAGGPQGPAGLACSRCVAARKPPGPPAGAGPGTAPRWLRIGAGEGGFIGIYFFPGGSVGRAGTLLKASTSSGETVIRSSFCETSSRL